MLEVEDIVDVIEDLPDNLEAQDIVDLFINIVEAYDMADSWIEIAICVGYALNELKKLRAESEMSTHH